MAICDATYFSTEPVIPVVLQPVQTIESGTGFRYLLMRGEIRIVRKDLRRRKRKASTGSCDEEREPGEQR